MSQYIHLIIKTQDVRAAIAEVNALTAGIFGNLEAYDAGESVANCMPAVCTQPHHVGSDIFLRVAIQPAFETLWPPGKYANFEIMPDYPTWVETGMDEVTGEVFLAPNRAPYNCGYITWTDNAGKSFTQPVMMGSWA